MSDKKKSVLGRGLGALLQESPSEPAGDSLPKDKRESGNVLDIPLSQIEVNPFQPRSTFDEESLKELSESIRVHGVIQPVTVRYISENKYELIAGERRLRASRLAGRTSIPAFVRLASDQESLEIALIENIQREDLNPIEIAINYKRLMDECGITQEQLSVRLGKSRSTVANFLRLLKLPPVIQAALRDDAISMGHAKVLLGVEELTRLMLAFKELTDKSLSVRQLENYLKTLSAGSKSKKQPNKKSDKLPAVRKWEDELTSKLSSRVIIKRTSKGSGEITIAFLNDEELERLVDEIAG